MFRSAPLLTLLKESTITSFVLIRFFLNVECTPTAVYRMRRVQPQKNRLIKVILPPSRFQQDVVSRAPRLLFYSHKGVYLPPPPSLTKEKWDRKRMERLAHVAPRNVPASRSTIVITHTVSDSVQSQVDVNSSIKGNL